MCLAPDRFRWRRQDAGLLVGGWVGVRAVDVVDGIQDAVKEGWCRGVVAWPACCALQTSLWQTEAGPRGIRSEDADKLDLAFYLRVPCHSGGPDGG